MKGHFTIEAKDAESIGPFALWIREKLNTSFMILKVEHGEIEVDFSDECLKDPKE